MGNRQACDGGEGLLTLPGVTRRGPDFYGFDGTRGRPAREVRGMIRHLGWIRSRVAVFFRSGGRVFACSLVVGLTLGSSSLVCLEVLDDRSEEARSGGSLSETTGQAEGGGREEAQPETSEIAKIAEPRPAEETRTSFEPRIEGALRGSMASDPGPGPEAREASLPEPGELEADLGEISSRYPGEYGILLWKPESGTRVAVGAEDSFSSASLAKLPVLLALYREAAEGRLSLDERIEMSASDIQPGTGVLQNYPPGTAMTLRECAEYLMKESDNTAWTMLEDRVGKKRVQLELASAGADSTRYEYAHHTTTPSDTLKLLRRISDPSYTSPQLSGEMLSAMTDTTFEGRLPVGLPADARISHKIGTLGTNFGDAGIVFPPERERRSEPYYVVVLSKQTSETAARSAMQEISLAAYRGLVDPEALPRPAPMEPALDAREEQERGDEPA